MTEVTLEEKVEVAHSIASAIHGDNDCRGRGLWDAVLILDQYEARLAATALASKDAELAAAREREAKLREAVRWIRDKAETGAWCQSDIVWFADEVLAGRNPYEKVQP